MKNQIKYKSGYKYQLFEDYFQHIGIFPDQNIVTQYINLGMSGLLWIKRAYAFDGPSGPTFDTKNFMRGSLVHDALYQLMRNGHLDHEQHRAAADRLLREICREDGMSWIRAWWVYRGVRWGGDTSTLPENAKKVETAP